jgi:hypothetical protein
MIGQSNMNDRSFDMTPNGILLDAKEQTENKRFNKHPILIRLLDILQTIMIKYDFCNI